MQSLETRIENLEKESSKFVAELKRNGLRQDALEIVLERLTDLYIGHLETLGDIYIRHFREELKPETFNDREETKAPLRTPTGPVIQYFADLQIHAIVKDRIDAVARETGVDTGNVLRRIVYRALGFES